MSETIYSLERDLREAEAMADALIPYVHEDHLYGNVSGMFNSGSMPTLTIGALLMRLHRLNALSGSMNDAQRTQLAQITLKHDQVRNEWTTHYTQKLTQEAISRTKAMDGFFDECKEKPRTCHYNYNPETLRRTIVQDISVALTRLGANSDEVDKVVRNADSKLRRFTTPSDFVWAKPLEPVYPRSEYWWLYAKPPMPDSE